MRPQCSRESEWRTWLSLGNSNIIYQWTYTIISRSILKCIRRSQWCHPRTMYLLLNIHYYHSASADHRGVICAQYIYWTYTITTRSILKCIRRSQWCHPCTMYLLDIHYCHSIHTEMHPPITAVSSVHNVSTRHTLLSLKPYCTASADHVGVIGVLFVQKIYTITNMLHTIVHRSSFFFTMLWPKSIQLTPLVYTLYPGP